MKNLPIILCLLCFGQIVQAQSKIVPIVETKLGGLLGGVENGKFIDAKTTFTALKDKHEYRLYDLATAKYSVFTTQIEKPEVPCENFYWTKNESELVGGIALGKDAAWNPLPRQVELIDLNNTTYKKIIADVLKTNGIITKIIKITQAFRVDLEGDGREEVLLAATSYVKNIASHSEKGDYSLIVLRKINGKTVKNIILTGDFVTKRIKFGAPEKYELSAIADLNGDGRMEIVVYGKYYEGDWVETYEITNDIPVKVKKLDAGCGI